ncbi:MAG: hypothetical protein ACOYOQ_15545, partial [Microthrixaceae bacterium]
MSAFVVGVFGPALQVWPLGPAGPAAALRLVVGGLVLVIVAARWPRPAGLAAAVLAGGAIMATSIALEGRAPACIALSLSTIAVVAVRRRRPGQPGRADGALQLLVVGLVGLSWLWTSSLRVVMAGLVLALGVLVTSALAPRAVAAGDRALDRA